MLYGLLTFVAPQLFGDLIADFLSVPVTGMVVGLILLLACFVLRGRLLGQERTIPTTSRSSARPEPGGDVN